MKVACIVFAYIVGAFFVVRAVIEVVTVDSGHAVSYEKDWGGPSLLGVLAVHCLPGAVALALMVWGALRLRQRTVD